MISKKHDDQKPFWEKEFNEYENFRNNLRLLRASRGKSAQELGKELSFPKYYRINDLEYGKSSVPKLQEIKRISEYFGVSIDDLLYKQAVVTFKEPYFFS